MSNKSAKLVFALPPEMKQCLELLASRHGYGSKMSVLLRGALWRGCKAIEADPSPSAVLDAEHEATREATLVRDYDSKMTKTEREHYDREAPSWLPLTITGEVRAD